MAAQLVEKLERHPWEELIPFLPRIADTVVRLTALQEAKAKRSDQENELRKHIFTLWHDDLLDNLWPPESFSLGRRVCRQLAVELLRMPGIEFR